MVVVVLRKAALVVNVVRPLLPVVVLFVLSVACIVNYFIDIDQIPATHAQVLPVGVCDARLAVAQEASWRVAKRVLPWTASTQMVPVVRARSRQIEGIVRAADPVDGELLLGDASLLRGHHAGASAKAGLVNRSNLDAAHEVARSVVNVVDDGRLLVACPWVLMVVAIDLCLGRVLLSRELLETNHHR